MFNMGFTEMLVIAVLALILIGPKQIPEVARNVGRFLNELKRTTESFTDELKSVTSEGRKSIFPPEVLTADSEKLQKEHNRNHKAHHRKIR